jgi:hypothetical protein
MSESKFSEDQWVINRSTGTPGMVVNSYPDAREIGEPMRWLYTIAFEATETKSTHTEANIPEEKLDFWYKPKFPVGAVVQTKLDAAAHVSGTVKLRSTSYVSADHLPLKSGSRQWLYLLQIDGRTSEGVQKRWLFEDELELRTMVDGEDSRVVFERERDALGKYERACRKLNQARTELRDALAAKERLHHRISELEALNAEKQAANEDLRQKYDRSRELHTKALQANDPLRVRVAELERDRATLAEQLERALQANQADDDLQEKLDKALERVGELDAELITMANARTKDVDDRRELEAAIDRLMAHIANQEILGIEHLKVPVAGIRDMIGTKLLRECGQRIFERTLHDHTS